MPDDGGLHHILRSQSTGYSPCTEALHGLAGAAATAADGDPASPAQTRVTASAASRAGAPRGGRWKVVRLELARTHLLPPVSVSVYCPASPCLPPLRLCPPGPPLYHHRLRPVHRNCGARQRGSRLPPEGAPALVLRRPTVSGSDTLPLCGVPSSHACALTLRSPRARLTPCRPPTKPRSSVYYVLCPSLHPTRPHGSTLDTTCPRFHAPSPNVPLALPSLLPVPYRPHAALPPRTQHSCPVPHRHPVGPEHLCLKSRARPPQLRSGAT